MPTQSGRSPARWWSDMDERDLLLELRHLAPYLNIEKAWTETDTGPAFALLDDGRVFEFHGDGTAASWGERRHVLSTDCWCKPTVEEVPRDA